MKYEVPFVANPDTRCLPATIAMIVRYFMPQKHFTLADGERLCGYVSDKATWPIVSMIELSKMGFELQWIEDFNLHEFSENPEGYLRKILKDPEALEYQIHKGNLPLEGARAKEYLSAGLPFERRAGTKEDIRRLLDDGWLVRLEVNGRPLAGKRGYDGHSVLVIGYDEKGATLHNPDGTYGSKPNQHVPWPLLEEVWREYGGTFSLYAFRKRS